MGYRLYAGDVPDMPEYDGLLGLSLSRKDHGHIIHDITGRHPFPDNSVDSYQSEDVFEHIEYDRLVPIINDIYRILKPGACFRLSVPDYGHPYMIGRCDIIEGIIIRDRDVPDHKWFPTEFSVLMLIGRSKFNNFKLVLSHSLTGEIDFNNGYVMRIPQNDKRSDKSISIVVDLYK